ncbi:MAG: SMI1/KNR4 family protein [Deltaproteobacteria bacterium]|nr:SMI1/KNR4 family protein [Deltaproteobacteria bacterium]
MTSDTIELVERVRRRLNEHENPCQIAGPAPETAISAAEEALGVTFPPSYRTFLRTFGGIAIPPHLGVVHDFVGVPGIASVAVKEPDGAADPATNDVVHRTLQARAQRKLAEHLVVVGMGAEFQEWFCLDIRSPTAAGEYPVLLFDARDNALDQQFYDDFGQMLAEVMGFVADSLEHPLD